MKLTNEEREQLKRQLQENIGWIEHGEEKTLSEAALSTAIAIFDVFLKSRGIRYERKKHKKFTL